METNLKKQIYESCVKTPRNSYDLMRTIGIFIPEDHELAIGFISRLESIRFSAPEIAPMHYHEFIDDFFNLFNPSDIKYHPTWVKSILIIIGGGCAEYGDL